MMRCALCTLSRSSSGRRFGLSKFGSMTRNAVTAQSTEDSDLARQSRVVWSGYQYTVILPIARERITYYSDIFICLMLTCVRLVGDLARSIDESLHGPCKPAHLASRSYHDTYQLTWATLGARVSPGVAGITAPRTPDAGRAGAQSQTGPKEGSVLGPVTPGSRGPLRGSPWSVRGHLGLFELEIST